MAREQLIRDLHDGTTYVNRGHEPRHLRKDAPVNWLIRAWRKIAEPKFQRIMYFIIYIFHTLAGLGVILGLPAQVPGLSGPQTIIWSAFLIAGGIMGAVAVIPGWNYFERVAIAACFFAILIFSVVLLVIPVHYPTVRLVSWCLITGWLAVFALRAWETRRYLIAPKG